MYPEQPSPQPQGDDNNIFMTKVAPPPTPDEKRKVALIATIGLIVGFAVLLVSMFMLLFLGANGAASDYRKTTATHLVTVTKKIQEVDIEAILSQKDITGTIAEVEKAEKNRPRLASVALGDSLSAAYQDTTGLQTEVDNYYKRLTKFSQELPGLLTFAQSAEETRADLIETVPTKELVVSSGQSQAAAGTVEDLSARVKDLTVPGALVESRDTLAKAYIELAEGYRDLAAALSDSSNSKSQAERRITNARNDIDDLSDSSAFASKVIESRTKLIDEAKSLLSRL